MSGNVYGWWTSLTDAQQEGYWSFASGPLFDPSLVYVHSTNIVVMVLTIPPPADRVSCLSHGASQVPKRMHGSAVLEREVPVMSLLLHVQVYMYSHLVINENVVLIRCTKTDI